MDRAGENIAYATCAPGANDVLMRSPRTGKPAGRGFTSRARGYLEQRPVVCGRGFAHEVRVYREQSGNSGAGHR